MEKVTDDTNDHTGDVLPENLYFPGTGKYALQPNYNAADEHTSYLRRVSPADVTAHISSARRFRTVGTG